MTFTGTGLRIAASTYLNSAPLVYGFAQGSLRNRYQFLGNAAPARCAALLAEGAADIALIPAIEYQRIPHLRLIPGLAVAARHQVGSVLLLTRKPLAQLERLTLDQASRTSQALVKVIFAERFGRQPKYVERLPAAAQRFENMLTAADGTLVIGDPAMQLAARAAALGLQIYDVATEWRQLTGLPFVFAVWAVRPEVAPTPALAQALAADFWQAKEEGLAQLPALAAASAAELGLPVPQLLNYLRTNVNYELDAENLAGLREYFRLAHRWRAATQLAECSAPRPLEFIVPPETSVLTGKSATASPQGALNG